MDHTFKSMCEFFNPKMTAEVMNGYVTHEFKSLDPKDEGYDLKGMEDRVNATLHKAFHGLLGGRLHYEGFERCTPQEEFDISTRPKNTKRMYELARSDFYMVKIKLSYLVAEGNRQPCRSRAREEHGPARQAEGLGPAHLRRCRYRPVADRLRQGASRTVAGDRLGRSIRRSRRGRFRRRRARKWQVYRRPGAGSCS